MNHEAVVGTEFAGKRVVVTGAANGIGLATALRFAQGGADLALLDIESVTEVAQAAAAYGGRVLPIQVDLTQRKATQAAFESIAAEYKDVDILINNVGQSARERAVAFTDSEPEVWDFVVAVSLMTTLHCSRLVAPGMRARRAGKIVNLSSDAMLLGSASGAEYVAAKGGVMAFTRGLARELAPFQVNVNAVAPGPTLTRGPLSLPPDLYQRAVGTIPMGQLCEPADIANAIAFLSSDQSRMITGQMLVVNGGRIFH